MRVKGKSIRLRRRKCWLTECCLTRIEWDWRLLYCVYSYVVLTKVCTLCGWVVSGGSDLGETLPAIRNCEEVAIHGVDKALLVALRIDHRGILALAAQDARSLDDGLHFLVQGEGANVIYNIQPLKYTKILVNSALGPTYDAQNEDAVFLVQTHQQ